mmetsp:Transcript_46783/g.101620  ORF Transcript_46783/g.101620 Transcript_46783/m.101620 type:complete len:200 (+) Transcript_46783:407-1006(+)
MRLSCLPLRERCLLLLHRATSSRRRRWNPSAPRLLRSRAPTSPRFKSTSRSTRASSQATPSRLATSLSTTRRRRSSRSSPSPSASRRGDKTPHRRGQARTRTHTNTRTHIHTHARTRTCTCTRTHIRTHVHTHARAHAHAHTALRPSRAVGRRTPVSPALAASRSSPLACMRQGAVHTTQAVLSAPPAFTAPLRWGSLG